MPRRDEVRRLEAEISARSSAPAAAQAPATARSSVVRLPAPRPASAGRGSGRHRAGRACAARIASSMPASRHQRWPMESSALVSALDSRSRAATRLASSVTATASAPSLRIASGFSRSARSAAIIARERPGIGDAAENRQQQPAIRHRDNRTGRAVGDDELHHFHPHPLGGKAGKTGPAADAGEIAGAIGFARRRRRRECGKTAGCADNPPRSAGRGRR